MKITEHKHCVIYVTEYLQLGIIESVVVVSSYLYKSSVKGGCTPTHSIHVFSAVCLFSLFVWG